VHAYSNFKTCLTYRIHFHGNPPAVTWTQLNDHIDEGDRTVVLKEAVTWKVGDDIVVASSDYHDKFTEEAKITAVSGDRKTLTVRSAFKNYHFGRLQTYPSPYRTWILDERAEVAHLTRNIVVRGGGDSILEKKGLIINS